MNVELFPYEPYESVKQDSSHDKWLKDEQPIVLVHGNTMKGQST